MTTQSDNVSNESVLWRTAGGSSARSGLFPRPVQVEPHPAHRLTVAGAVQASVVFDDSARAFVADMSGTVQAFSAQGELLWRVKLAGGISATPVVCTARPQLFVATHRGRVYALNTADGSVLWQTDIPTKSDPRILSDLLYIKASDAVVLSSWGGRFCALATQSGEQRFSWDAGISPSSPAAADQSGRIYCLRAVSGKGVEFVRVSSDGQESVLHRAPEGKGGARRTVVDAAPVLDEERGVAYVVLNGDRDATLLAWSLRSDAVAWTRALPACVQATPTVRKDGAILIPDLAGELPAIGPEGTVLFKYKTGCEYLLAGTACEAGNTCFLGDPVGLVHVINGRGEGKTIYEAPRSIQSRPSFAPDGSLYVPATDRHVYVFSSA